MSTPQTVCAQQLGNSGVEPIENPIYIADSPIASESLLRLPELIAQDNLDEAARLVNQIITELGDRLIEGHTPGVFIPVRQRMHRFVLDEPELLALYRTQRSPSAKRMLDEGQWERVARDAWLTEPGMIASIHQIQTLIEGAHFHASLRLLDNLKSHPDADLFTNQTTKLSKLAANFTTSFTPPFVSPQAQSSLPWKQTTTQSNVNLDGILPSALGQAELTPQAQINRLENLSNNRLSGANWEPTAWAAPVVMGDFLYTNDGITVSCFDRFTLRPIWRLGTSADISEMPVAPDTRARLGRVIEDATTITAIGHDLYVPAGIPRDGKRNGSSRLLKLDANTGKVHWSVDISTLDSTLSDASIRGQVVVDEGIVLVGARTNNRRKRLITLSIVGLDAATGDLLWVRQIASAGSLPFQQMGQLAHSPTLADGVVYWTDHIGLGFAIESATGRVLWARPLPAPDLYARFSRPSFSNNTPVINEFGFFTLSSDGTKIIQLDLNTGQTLSTRPAEPVGEALYLLEVDGLIACVSKFQVTYFPANRFEHAASTRSEISGSTTGIRGRVVVMGKKLLAPIETGVQILDPRRPQYKHHTELDSTGNIIALDGQLLVVDEMNVSSYLAWETASAMLGDRIDTDPASAITLAQLAHRAHRVDEVVPAVVRARDVIARQPITQREELNNQLFAVLHDLVTPTQSAQPNEQLLPAKEMTVLFDLLSDLAHSHEQVVAHRMALGNWNALRGKAINAIDAYQDILDQPALSASMWKGTGIAVRGGIEATRRIGALLEINGYSSYHKINQLAQAEQIFLENADTPKPYEQLAVRYPWATITPKLWLTSANLWRSKSQTPAMITAANNGLDAARSLDKLGEHVDQHTIDLLAEHAITGMISTNRAKDAQTLAAQLILDFPKLTIRVAGEEITQDQITRKARIAAQLPVLGDVFLQDDQPVLIAGSPINPVHRIDQGGIVMHAPQLGRISYLRVGRNVFETVWSRKARSNETPIIPWQDESRTLILWPEGSDTPDTGTIEAIETTTGKVVWSIENIRTTLAENSQRIPDDIARVDGIFTAPAQGQAPINQLVVVTDGHTLIITDRIGRAMGVDLFTGDKLWQIDLPANRVYDIDLKGGVLGICGVMHLDNALEQQRGSTTSIVASINPRTGETIQVIDRFGQSPRWIRVGADGNLFVATKERIVAINTNQGSIDWMISDESLHESLGGWIAGDQLLVLNSSTDLWSLSLAQGAHQSRPLNLRQQLTPRSWIQVRPMVNSVLVAGSHGFSVFDQHQQLIANDPISTAASMMYSAWGLNRVVFAQRTQQLSDESHTTLLLLDLHDARLLDTTTLTIPRVLDRSATSIAAITGGIIVGFNEVSVFVRTTKAVQ
ncbi:MAG: PQQ-binding-like beta-propeller repeat protein [Phycisphaerales bacterium]|nr:PQQ-binding-like beta-propeller repeat protein [Phycisphaerales bacterium]